MTKQKPNKKKNSVKKEIKEKSSSPFLWLTGVLILVLIAHFPSLFNGFTNWDDPAYITQNDFIKSFNSENFKAIFGEFHNGHYHPLTWISLAFDFSLYELKPFGFHLFNLIFHLINVYFVFVFIKMLTTNWKIALFTALFFGITPLSVETVAWVTERKNLLYTLFYLASLISYIKYLNKNKLTFYLLSLILFLLSLLSKSMAITLPVVLILIDYFKGRSLKLKQIWIEKLPFVIFAIGFGISGIMAQSVVATESVVPITWDSKIMYGSWGFLNYFVRLIIPFKLSAFYPFLPQYYPIYYSIGIAFVLFFAWFLYRSWKKKHKTLVFGLLFFVVNLFLFLKFFSTISNSVYMADRYTYISSIGLFFIAGTLLVKLKKSTWLLILTTFTVYYSIYTFNQSKVWKNSIALWNNVIEQYPGAHVPLLNRGNAYREEKQYAQALADYNLILQTDSVYFEALVNRGFVYYTQNNFHLAYNDYVNALKIKPDDKNTLVNKSLCLEKMGKVEEAAMQAQAQVDKGEGNALSFNILGNASFAKNDFHKAIELYSKAIDLDPSVALYWYNRANSRAMLKKHTDALADYDKAIEIDNTNSDYFFNRGTTRYFVKDNIGAKRDMESAIKLNSTNTTYFLNKSNVELALGNNDNAIKDLTSAINLDVNNAQNYARRAVIYFQLNRKGEGCKDANTSVRLGFTQANELLQKYCQ